jgi:hypothetical protein
VNRQENRPFSVSSHHSPSSAIHGDHQLPLIRCSTRRHATASAFPRLFVPPLLFLHPPLTPPPVRHVPLVSVRPSPPSHLYALSMSLLFDGTSVSFTFIPIPRTLLSPSLVECAPLVLPPTCLLSLPVPTVHSHSISSVNSLWPFAVMLLSVSTGCQFARVPPSRQPSCVVQFRLMGFLPIAFASSCSLCSLVPILCLDLWAAASFFHKHMVRLVFSLTLDLIKFASPF